MNNEEAKIHLQSAKLMLLGADGQPVSDLYYAVEKGIEALDQGDVLQEIRQEIKNRINNCDDSNFKDGLCEAFDIVYCKIKEFSE